MTRIATIMIIFYGGWLIMGAPILGFQKKPLTPSADLPTFEEVQARSKALREAFKEGLIQEDPARQELRFSVLDAFEELKDSPCDKAVRQTYVKAIRPFIKRNIRDRASTPVEIYEHYGKKLNATCMFDEAARSTIYQALMFGYLDGKDRPGAAGRAFAMAKKFTNAKTALAKSRIAPKCNATG